MDPLRHLLDESAAPLPQTRLDALWTLQGLNALSDEDLQRGLADRDPQVRVQALVLAENRLEASAGLKRRAVNLAQDSDPRVRFQAAFSLGSTHDRRTIEALTRIARTRWGQPLVSGGGLELEWHDCRSTVRHALERIFAGDICWWRGDEA